MTAHSSTHSRRRRLGLLAVSAASLVSLATAGIAVADPAGASASSAVAAALPWMNTSLTPEQRASLLIQGLSLPQKMQQLTGAFPEIVPELPQCYGARHVTRNPSAGHPHACASPTGRWASARTTASTRALNNPNAPFTRGLHAPLVGQGDRAAVGHDRGRVVRSRRSPATFGRDRRHGDEQPGTARLRGAGREHGSPAGPGAQLRVLRRGPVPRPARWPWRRSRRCRTKGLIAMAEALRRQRAGDQPHDAADHGGRRAHAARDRTCCRSRWRSRTATSPRSCARTTTSTASRRARTSTC